MTYEADIRILGGLPVTVAYSVQSAEPDVGIMSDYVDDWYIVAVNGRVPKTKKGKAFAWIYSRLTKADERAILDELNEMEG